MPHTTVRVRKTTHARIRALAEHSGDSMQSVIDQAIELLVRRRFLDGVNDAYSALRRDQAEWLSIREEQAEWDIALSDGLDRADDVLDRNLGGNNLADNDVDDNNSADNDLADNGENVGVAIEGPRQDP